MEGSTQLLLVAIVALLTVVSGMMALFGRLILQGLADLKKDNANQWEVIREHEGLISGIQHVCAFATGHRFSASAEREPGVPGAD